MCASFNRADCVPATAALTRARAGVWWQSPFEGLTRIRRWDLRGTGHDGDPSRVHVVRLQPIARSVQRDVRSGHQDDRRQVQPARHLCATDSLTLPPP